MSTTTTKPVKTLDDIAGEDGIFSIIAMDQRNTLRRMFTAVGIEASDEDLRTSKADVARALTPMASGILFDPTYGVPAVTRQRRIAPELRAAGRLRAVGAGHFNGEPRTHRDPELDAQWVLDQGGDANKFFAQLRADRPAPKAGEPDLVADCLEAVRQVIADCRAVGVPSVIENLVYPLPGEELQRPAARGRDHRGRACAQRARRRPAEAGVPRLARGLPAARLGPRPAVGGAVRGRAVRPVHRGPAGCLRRRRCLRLHRRPVGVARVPALQGAERRSSWPRSPGRGWTPCSRWRPTERGRGRARFRLLGPEAGVPATPESSVRRRVVRTSKPPPSPHSEYPGNPSFRNESVTSSAHPLHERNVRSTLPTALSDSAVSGGPDTGQFLPLPRQARTGSVPPRGEERCALCWDVGRPSGRDAVFDVGSDLGRTPQAAVAGAADDSARTPDAGRCRRAGWGQPQDRVSGPQCGVRRRGGDRRAGSRGGRSARVPAEPDCPRARLAPDDSRGGSGHPEPVRLVHGGSRGGGRGQPRLLATCNSSPPATSTMHRGSADSRAPSSSAGWMRSSSCPPPATRPTCRPTSTTGSSSWRWIVRWKGWTSTPSRSTTRPAHGSPWRGCSPPGTGASPPSGSTRGCGR